MIISSEDEMIRLGRELARKVRAEQNDDRAVAVELIGDVGTGKTTLTRGLAEGLGVKDVVGSPSFTISKTYALPEGGRLVHYDFYRLSEPGLMVEDLSENLANSQNVVVIEWGESVASVLPEKRLRVEIEYNDDGTRSVISSL